MMFKLQPPTIESSLRGHGILKMPEACYSASGIIINGRRIKTFLFSTDIALIRNCDADAVFAVYPFTPQQAISEAIIKNSYIPVFCGVGGGTTKGLRTIGLAKDVESQGAMGVIMNAPISNLNLAAVAAAVDIPVIIMFALIISLGVNLYSLRHLPIIDFMSYKEGVDLRSAISQRRAVDYVLVCRNSVTGEVREFAADDTAWYDGWEVVDTRDANSSELSPFTDFMVYDAAGVEQSRELLQREGRTIWLCVRSVESLDSKRMRAIEQLLEQTTDSNIVVLTSDNVEDVYDTLNLECYAIDSVVLTSIMRADVGVVVLEDGVIVDKLNILDI